MIEGIWVLIAGNGGKLRSVKSAPVLGADLWGSVELTIAYENK